MNILKGMDVIILSFTAAGTELNRRLCVKIRGAFGSEEAPGRCGGYTPEKYAGRGISPLPADKRALIGGSWGKAAFIFIGAAGIAVRYIAPWVKDKYTDSPVLVIDEKGQYVIPLLSGHVGGAVSLADKIAELLGAVSVHTTATDVQGKFAVDVFAKKNSLVITDREAAKNISAAVLNGEKIAFYIERTESEGLDNEARTVRVGGRLPKEIILCESEREMESYDYRIIVRAASETNDQSIQSGTRQEICKMDSEKCTLILLLGNIAAGIGCRKQIDDSVLEKGFLDILRANGLDISQVKSVASIDLKKDESAILQLCEKYHIPFVTYTAGELGQVQDVSSGSEFVKKVTGVDNVCERAARLSCGDGNMIQGKCIREGMTAALVRCPVELIF